jgi:hypothetical protein
MIRGFIYVWRSAMLFRVLHRIGVPSDLLYLASLGSIAASIVAWSVRSEKNAANAERLGIFIGLWAPTFMLIGHGIQQVAVQRGTASPPLEAAARKGAQLADDVRLRANVAVKP